MTKLQTDALFTQYLNVLNRVLGENRDEIPYRQVIAAAGKMLEDKNLGVGVYKEDSSTPHDWFTVQWQDGTFELLEHGKGEDLDLTCKVARSHLENVVEKPQTFVEHPYKLDLDWLTTRLGVAALTSVG